MAWGVCCLEFEHSLEALQCSNPRKGAVGADSCGLSMAGLDCCMGLGQNVGAIQSSHSQFRAVGPDGSLSGVQILHYV
jgi:hypothetical protein